MKDNNWTAKELQLNQQLNRLCDEDTVEIPALDISFMDKSALRKSPRKRFWRIAKIAAVIMLMAASSLVTAICISGGYVEAFKDHVEKKMFVWKSGVMVTEDEEFVDENIETWEITDAKLIPKLKEILYGIRIPQYIPTEYEFENAFVEYSADDEYIASFYYMNGQHRLSVIQTPIQDGATVGGNSDGEVIQLSDRTISMWEDHFSDIIGCSIFFDDVMIQISAEELSDDEVLKIAKEMK